MESPAAPTALDVPSSGTPGLRGWLATPAGAGPHPAVVVVHEAFGVDDVMKRQLTRLADAGFLALMPDLFTAGGPRRCLLSTLRAVRSGHGRAYDDIDATRRLLAAREDCTGRVGIIGFCMGGGFALMSATRGFDVASANYGVVPKDPVHTLAGACPVIASYGGKDKALGEKVAFRLERALDDARVEHRVDVYPEAGHSFLNDAEAGPAWMRRLAPVTHVGPEPASAAVAWERIEAFLHEHLDGPGDDDA